MKASGEKLANLLAGDVDYIIYLHNTRSEEIARKIMAEGFTFQNQIYYSTDRINPKDSIEISYFLVERKDYGDYTMIIEISKKLFKNACAVAEKSGLSFEDLLSSSKPVLGEDDEYIYTLPQQYIKGYYNNKTGIFYNNDVFDPEYISDKASRVFDNG
jgi:hypothetical protein